MPAPRTKSTSSNELSGCSFPVPIPRGLAIFAGALHCAPCATPACPAVGGRRGAKGIGKIGSNNCRPEKATPEADNLRYQAPAV